MSGAFEHLLAYGDLRELTDEELAQAVHLDPSQIAGLGPSIDFLRQLLVERKRKLLEALLKTQHVQQAAADAFRQRAAGLKPPRALRDPLQQAIEREQLRELGALVRYRAGDERLAFCPRLAADNNRRAWETSTRLTNWLANTSSPAASG